MVVDSFERFVDKIVHYSNANTIPSFYTKREALAYGASYGWREAIKVKCRFETIWIVAAKDFEPSETLGVVYDTYKIPLLRWDKNHNGVTFCPVVNIKVKRPIDTFFQP